MISQSGRTAWSAVVTVDSTNCDARYCYDGQFLNNAKEDAAEVGSTKLKDPAIATNISFHWNGEARETEKSEPKEELVSGGTLFNAGEDILD